MKRVLAILLAAVLRFSLAACGSKTESAEFTATAENANVAEEVGSYILYEMSSGGETFDNAFLSSVGMDTLYTVELKEDGSGLMKLGEDEIPVTWKDGKIDRCLPRVGTKGSARGKLEKGASYASANYGI